MKFLRIVFLTLLPVSFLIAGTPTSSPRAVSSPGRLHLNELFENPLPSEELCHLDRMWKYGIYPLMHKESIVQYFAKYQIKRVLTLASGANPSVKGLVVLSKGSVEAWATDIIYGPVMEEHESFFKAFMDNSKPFPFAANSFDLISMVSGLCLCNSSRPLRTCCGVEATVAKMSLFFRRVLRILNSENPNSMAILQGEGKLDLFNELLIESAEAALAADSGPFCL